MTYVIGKQFHFSAAHRLEQLPKTHQCYRQHGHNYTVTIVLAGDTLDEWHFITDYDNLKSVKVWIDSVLDHQDLNEVVAFPTTAENMARWIWDSWRDSVVFGDLLHTVIVQETPKTMAAYAGDGRTPIVWTP